MLYMAKTLFEKKQNNAESLKELKKRKEDYCPSFECISSENPFQIVLESWEIRKLILTVYLVFPL